ncbi:DUF945 family protein [Ferrimonas lipolytica]|uniref:YdgA family protein n=1 Tax=Ferrimonas lipolytica TaxID=2724191 RepID=A0A6H1UDH6_9GAMM|nr:DUF945 family protein [Ferrimonas lipolytica]QIZ77094.1 YdgA family protein [Ferrimonas lipolytica]
MSTTLAATWYIASQYEQYRLNALERFNNQTGSTQLSHTISDRNLFNHNEHYRISAYADGSNKLVELQFNQQVKFYPGFVKATYSIDTSSPSWQVVGQQLKQPLLNHGSWSASIFSQQGNYRYQVDGFESKPTSLDEYISTGDIVVDGTFALDLSEYSSQLSIAAATIGFAQRVFELEGLSASSTMTLLDDIYDINFSHSSIDSLTAYQLGNTTTATKPLRFKLNDLKLSNGNLHRQGNSSSSTTLTIGALALSANDDIDITLTDARLATKVSNVATSAYINLARFIQQGSQPDALASALTDIDTILANNLQLDIQAFEGDITLASRDEKIAGHYAAIGQIVLHPTNLAQLQTSQPFALIDAKLSLNFSDTMFSQHPLATQLDNFEQHGFLNRADGQFTTSVIFENAQLSLNDQPLQL